MPLDRRGRSSGERRKAQTVGLAVVFAMILLETVLPALLSRIRYAFHRIPVMEPGASVAAAGGGLLTVLAVILLGVAAAVGVLLALSRRKRPGGDEVMHEDHYRRTEREHAHYSADPCAYSERYSRRRSRRYDDPWDF